MNQSKIDYYMGKAEATAKGSKDPSTQVGCVVVRPDGTESAQGYNGMVKGIDERIFWASRDVKLEAVLHAEMNAIIHSKEDLTGHRMFVTHAPCVVCLKLALQAGIKQIYYKDSSIMKRTSDISNKVVVMLLEASMVPVKNITTGKFLEEEIAEHFKSKENVCRS